MALAKPQIIHINTHVGNKKIHPPGEPEHARNPGIFLPAIER
jgi:hypothetical protein